MFVLLEGRLSVTIGENGSAGQTLAQLEPGSIIGEVAMVAGGRRSATVRAETLSRVAVLGAEGFNLLLENHPDVAASFARLASRRLRQQQLFSQMASLFSQLDPDALHALEQSVEWVSLAAGETLFQQGNTADSAYMVVSGRLFAQTRQPDGSLLTVGEVGRGELVGEYALIMDQPRGATVIAKKDTDLARIPCEVFMQLIATRSDILLELTRTIIRRSGTPQVQLERSRNQQRTIAVVYLDADIRNDRFCDTLRTQLSRHGATIHLDSDRIGVLLDKPGIADSVADDPAHIRLLQWLGQIESTHRFVVYRTDGHFSRWTERAIRHADEIVFVADARSSPQQREIEMELARMRQSSHQRCSLVLLHDTGTKRPHGTAAWISAREVDAVYHVRRNNEADAARLGRILAGTALGLVLGGGGARGFAHLGVFRALEELDVPIDMIGGASIGAPIAQGPAQGINAAESLSLVQDGFRSLLDYTLPLTALLAGVRITETIERQATGWNIEDLWIPYYCVSTNMTTAREVHHRTGDLARAVRASVSIPGVLPPVPEGKDLLVDGGVMNNLPIDVMRTINPTGPIIAVDVTPHAGPSAKSDYGLAISGRKIIASRLDPRRHAMKVPSVGNTILRSMMVGADRIRSQQLSAKLADLYLNIDIRDVGLLEFERVADVAAIGYEQGLPAIQKWLESRDCDGF